MQKRIVVTGARGRLGRELVRAFDRKNVATIPISTAELDITEGDAAARIADLRPTVVVNAAAWTDVDACANNPARAEAVNATGAGFVAQAAARAGALIVHISTNEVFDGTADQPYQENDEPNPINPYGRSKHLGELLVADATTDHLIVRTAWLFGTYGDSFVTKIRAAANASPSGAPVRVVDDEWGNPTWIPALANIISDLATSDVRGILHVAGQPATSRFGWAQAILSGTFTGIEPISSASYERASSVPLRAVLSMERARSYGVPDIDWRPHVAEPVVAPVCGG